MLDNFSELVKNNAVLASLISLYGIGILTFLFRNIPSKLFLFLKREFTTELILTSQNNSFHNALKWFEEEFKNK